MRHCPALMGGGQRTKVNLMSPPVSRIQVRRGALMFGQHVSMLPTATASAGRGPTHRHGCCCISRREPRHRVQMVTVTRTERSSRPTSANAAPDGEARVPLEGIDGRRPAAYTGWSAAQSLHALGRTPRLRRGALERVLLVRAGIGQRRRHATCVLSQGGRDLAHPQPSRA